jgi:hypothetical protein
MPAIGNLDADLLRYHSSLIHAGYAAASESTTFLPVEGKLAVSILPIDRVDLDSRRATTDFHDAVATFFLLRVIKPCFGVNLSDIFCGELVAPGSLSSLSE